MKPKPDERKQELERELEEGLKETFPASDPPTATQPAYERMLPDCMRRKPLERSRAASAVSLIVPSIAPASITRHRTLRDPSTTGFTISRGGPCRQLNSGKRM